MDGVSLYPLLDELGDMIAMSFEYTKRSKMKKLRISRHTRQTFIINGNNRETVGN